jgi:hypothetical protein
MELKMLSYDDIKKYIDNLDEIKLDANNISKCHKQVMSPEELEIYRKNYEMIINQFGKLKDSGYAGEMLASDSCAKKNNLYKLYINPGPEIARFVVPFINKCNEVGLGAELKIMMPCEIEDKQRSDVVNIYTNSPENIKKVYEILMQVVKENNIELRRKTKGFSISLDPNDTIGLGYDKINKTHSWSTSLEELLSYRIIEYFKEKGDLTSKEITSIKQESPEKYAKFCQDLYKILNTECLYQAKKICGLRDILTMQKSKQTSEKMNPSILQDGGEIQINGLKGKLNYSKYSKRYFVLYQGQEDKQKETCYDPEVILGAFNRGEMTFVKKELNKKNVEPVQKRQQEQANQLPEGARWHLGRNGEYSLIFKVGNDTRSMPANLAWKHYGVTPPDKTSLIKEAKWVLGKNGKYDFVFEKIDGTKVRMMATGAQKLYGVTPPGVTPPNQLKGVENIAKTSKYRDVQSTSSEIKEGYKDTKSNNKNTYDKNDNNIEK